MADQGSILDAVFPDHLSGGIRMSDITQFVRNRKLLEALSAIPPAKHQQEFAAAIAADKERRNELRSKFDELPTDEIERLWSLSSSRGSITKLETGE
jgi:hypothetical protein